MHAQASSDGDADGQVLYEGIKAGPDFAQPAADVPPSGGFVPPFWYVVSLISIHSLAQTSSSPYFLFFPYLRTLPYFLFFPCT